MNGKRVHFHHRSDTFLLRIVVIFHNFFTRHDGIAETGAFIWRFFYFCLRPCESSRSVWRTTTICVVSWWWNFIGDVHIQIGIVCKSTRGSKATASLSIIPAYFLAILHLGVRICINLPLRLQIDLYCAIAYAATSIRIRRFTYHFNVFF